MNTLHSALLFATLSAALPTTAFAADPAPLLAPAAAANEVAMPEISATELLERQARNDPSLLVLDVRTAEEFAAGHVPGAVNVPHDQVATRLAELPKERDIVLYCRSGRRVAAAAEVLAANGFKRLAHLTGDLPGWADAGHPVAPSTRGP